MLKKRRMLVKAICGCLATALSLGSGVSVFANNTIPDSDISSMEILQSANVEKIYINADTECKTGTALEFEILVEQAGSYELELQFTAKDSDNPIISLQIDGDYTFSGAERIEFPNNWVNSGGARTDERGNEIAPEQVLSKEVVSATARDRTGLYELPYTFNLSVGIHKIYLEVYQGEFNLSSIIFKPPEESIKYSEWLEKHTIDSNINRTETIEGEDAVLKSARSLIPLADSTSSDISPASPNVKKLNYIGGSNWSSVGDTLTWEFECKESGYYYLGFQYRQNTVINGVSYRHLKLDGKTPFKEAERLKFTYNNSWEYLEYGAEDDPYLFYLDEGKHTISLTVTAGELSKVYSELKDVIASLGELYIDITMIVGETVDNYRSYELFNQIPDFNQRLEDNIGYLNNLISTIEKLQEESNGSLVSNIVSAVEILQQMLDNPYTAHRYKTAYYTAYTNLSATLGTLTNMPLDIDRIFIIGNKGKPVDTSEPFWNKAAFSAKRFLNTFVNDYSVSEARETKNLDLWVNWGRDQAQVLNVLIREKFTPEYNVSVDVKVSNATVIQGILAGKGPDVLLQMTRTEPVDLAMRGALVDLTRYEDYDEVINRFNSGAMVPYEYKGGTYALPDTQNFYMMFVRTDILDEFGLEIPETWDEFFRAATILQRSNLQVSLPYTQITSSTTVNVGVGGLTLYPTVLLQNGLSLYNDELNESTLTKPEQLKMFTEWCEWYTKYKIPTVMDFYNRFRIGSAPIGIATYTLATQIKATAPEIDGNWTVARLPGVERGDGTVNYVSAGAGTGCAITKLSQNKEAAWKFLKWWTSAETQVEFSNNLESYIGPLGRVATSNIEAFDDMGWDAELLPAIKDQQANVQEIPEIPGGYYTARGIDQAFWNVIEQNKKPKDMLTEWGDIVNKEIKRKQAEYSN